MTDNNPKANSVAPIIPAEEKPSDPNDMVIRGKPLPSVPMPDTVMPLDYWSHLEGQRRRYCR